MTTETTATPQPPPSAEAPAPAAPAPTPEQARITDLEQQLAAANAHILDALPAHLKPLVPNTSVAERIDWISKAKAAGLFTSTVPVPTTDSGKAQTTPRDIDLSTLPPAARMAAGYR